MKLWRRDTIVLLLLLLFCSTTVRAQECATEADCPQNVETPFCAGAFCIDGYCVSKPPPCSTHCSETLKACVGCETNEDCIGSKLGGICDPSTHVCRPCYDMFDCPEGDYCHGGPWDCVGGKCLAPSSARYPCTDPGQCHEPTRTCTGCTMDEHCGSYDFCTNNRFCNRTSGQCDGIGSGTRMCDRLQMHCDSRQERCVQCRFDNDCRILDTSFCAPTFVCARPSQQCRPAVDLLGEIPPAPPCNRGEQIEVCDEERKMCLPRICVDDSECQDGNDCNGREHCASGVCARPIQWQRACPEGQYCSDGKSCSIECLSLSDCAELAYVCKKREVGGVDGVKALCVPCRTDAECQNGISEDGFETCDQTTGKCLAGISPCRGAPPGSVYDPRTGLCAPPRPQATEETTAATTSKKGEEVAAATTAAVINIFAAQTSGFPWVRMLITVIGVASVTVLLVVVCSPLWAASKWQLWRRRLRLEQSPPTVEEKEGEEEEEEGDGEEAAQFVTSTNLFARAPQFMDKEPIDNW